VGGELNRKQLASAYYRFEILCEIQENKLDQPTKVNGRLPLIGVHQKPPASFHLIKRYLRF